MQIALRGCGKMGAKLLSYEYVPSGFEITIENADVEMGKIWNLWHNVKLTDDPESWDSEIKLINQMQSRLGKLATDQRLIRAQIAEFCRVCPIFPRSIDILCNEIGQSHFSNPVKIGCEGRGLLDTLGYHDQTSLNKQQKETLSGQLNALKKWLENSKAETATESKIFGFLGRFADTKISAVKNITHAVNSGEPSMPSFRKLTEDICKQTQRKAVATTSERYRGRPFNCFECLPESTSTAKCQCCHSMLLDASTLCVGTSGEKRSMLEEFRHFIEENILIYSFAINAWLTEKPLKRIEWLEDARYVSKDNASRIDERVHSSLGKKNKVKEWLAASLLKTIKDNQRWRKRTELSDDFPETTSYFDRTL